MGPPKRHARASRATLECAHAGRVLGNSGHHLGQLDAVLGAVNALRMPLPAPTALARGLRALAAPARRASRGNYMMARNGVPASR
jgi:hypothetical protein